MKAREERLAVWMYGRHVASLSRARGRLSLAYTEEAQNRYDVNTPLISISLPVRPGVYQQDKVLPFFDGLLPEGETRRMLAYDFRLQADDVFGLLAALGRDCAGAVVILPEGESPPEPGASTPVRLTGPELADRLNRLAVDPLGVDGQVRISLAGVQQKLVLSRLPDGSWALPIGGLPSTHILKRADARFPGMVANEAFCLAVLRHLGIPAASAEILVTTEPILVVTRYDRIVTPEGEIRRIHQEDLTQALGLGPGAKYEERGGPSLRTTARLLGDWARGSSDVLRLLDLTIANMVLGNADAHAKNFSLLHQESGAVELAPAYDVMSTVVYPQADVRPAMTVNGKASILDVTPHDIIAEAANWRLDPRMANAGVEELLARLPAAIAAASAEVPGVPREVLEFVMARSAAFTKSPVKPRSSDLAI